MIKTALTIAGSDPSGGAGIQADLKVFTMLGVYGMAVPAALTAQNTRGVDAVKAVPPVFMRAQLVSLLSDVHVDAAKVGMLLTAATVEAVADAVRLYRLTNLVVDPLMVSSSGRMLLRKDAQAALVEKLIPLAELVMPNLDEAAVLAGMDVETLADMAEAAKRIHGMGPRFVLIKGGHFKGDAVDVFYNGSEVFEYAGRRVLGKKLHGAGCVYSAAVTAGLASGMTVMEAVAAAKKFVAAAIEKAEPVGGGRVALV
ncbi:MAG: bifunctional hydroxymethylpyrimidine kinase/phosphomethylpyrimidine kinase [Nitrospirae bacterium]|nr:bifunctional hydroxymethylpyrimidine kinase/phosphomethylpyrimidine kinase [Nitrospirota bacterium]